jgi:hypothetical protein
VAISGTFSVARRRVAAGLEGAGLFDESREEGANVRKLVVALAVVLAGLGVAALNGGTAQADGPPKIPFYDNNGTWACEAEAELPANHCINVRSQGSVGVIKVFAPEADWPVEGISTDPKADSRPCPHDADADPDGTWWEVLPGVYVCHHR